MKLSEYARREGIQYRAAWNRFKAGKVPGAYMTDDGKIVVPDVVEAEVPRCVVYARVSTHKQKDDLKRQADRMVEFAIANGMTVVEVVTEVASGVNDNRPKLTRILQRPDWTSLVVEHKDRLSRVGFEWFQVLLNTQGKKVVVANLAEEEKADLMDDFVSIIYSFAARLYGLRSARRRTDAATAALQAEVAGDG